MLPALALLHFACAADHAVPEDEIIVTLAPREAQVHVYYTLQFSVRVKNSSNQDVAWTISGSGCSGADCGTISDAGLYTAPIQVPSPPTIMITATSVADPHKSASATITILEEAIESDQWIWMSGVDMLGKSGSFGTKGVPSPSNCPEPRQEAASWTGPDGSLWLFGGRYQNGHINDLWRYDHTHEEWTWISGSNWGNQPGHFGTKGVPDAANVPGARAGSAEWTDADGCLWLFGGDGFDANGTFGYMSDLWKFDSLEGVWTWVSGPELSRRPASYGTKGIPDPSNMPGARTGLSSWVDAEGNFWLFGGWGVDSVPEELVGYCNDLWKFDLKTLCWTWMSGSKVCGQAGSYGDRGSSAPANVPGSRQWSLTWTDPDGRLWLFGGQGYDATGTAGALNDLWRFDPRTLEWTWVAGSDLRGQAGTYGQKRVASPSNHPGARSLAVSWTDPQGMFWLFGGVGSAANGLGGRLNDLWKYNPQSGEWTWISGDSVPNLWGSYGIRHIWCIGNVPPSRYAAVSWTDLAGNLWLFGGFGQFFEITGMFNDLWRYAR
jgi:N-acetylneuraminic acid mutarotase